MQGSEQHQDAIPLGGGRGNDSQLPREIHAHGKDVSVPPVPPAAHAGRLDDMRSSNVVRVADITLMSRDVEKRSAFYEKIGLTKTLDRVV